MDGTNRFDSCDLRNSHPSGTPVLLCTNFLGERDVHFLEQYAMCDNHYCVIRKEIDTGRTNVLSCSGGMIRFAGDDDYFFNPISPFKPNFSVLRELPYSYSLHNMQYYMKDVRTVFEHDILSVACSDDMMTCVRFHNDTACFGNTGGHFVFTNNVSVMVAIVVALLSFVCTQQLVVRSVALHSWSVALLYVLPLAGVYCIMEGALIVPTRSYALVALVMIGTLSHAWRLKLLYQYSPLNQSTSNP